VAVTEQIRTVAAGRRGPAPYGWEWDRGTLVPVPREQAIRWLILHMRGQGYSLRRISAELDRLRIPTRVGLRVWPIKNLQRIVNAPEATVADAG
jgi:hypothetical protein